MIARKTYKTFLANITEVITMWDEIQDMPGEIFDFDQWVEDIASDPEFIAKVERNNAEFDAEVAALEQVF